MRAGVPYAIAAGLVGVSFGVLARPVMGPAPAIVMSVIVFAGSAQFAALAVLSAGGGALPAIVAGVLLNLRFVPMGIAIAPWLPHRSLGRALRGQALVDASWALANRGDGRFDTEFLVGSTLVQYPAWVLGTVLGVVVGASIGNPDTLGLDAIFPAFFLGLLLNEIRRPGAAVVCVLGAVIALALIPVAPAGVPIIAASVAVVAGLRRPPAAGSTGADSP
jgi:4-azaleucine resistance transporter AzlC